jgi:ribosomal protein S18 acetylase RimI-like enzyme
MDSGTDSRQVGNHLLGPHVVGQRVVVRRVLRGETGPSGGPAMTDVLGVCTAWGDGRCVVAPETGPPVEIAVADIVSGKPVPPRPSVRHRVSTRHAEEHTLSLFAGLETERLGDWVLRTVPVLEGRLVKRANSCLAIGDPGIDLVAAAERVRAFYETRDRPVLAQVEAGSEVDSALSAAGWTPVPGGDADFLLASLSRALRSCNAVSATLGAAHEHPSASRTPRYSEGGGGRVRVELGDGAATGEAALDGDWLGLHHLQVGEDHRRQGLGTQVLGALLEWGAERGATTAWLHVEVDNDPARALYERVGFRTHHTCRYLRWGS